MTIVAALVLGYFGLAFLLVRKWWWSAVLFGLAAILIR
jgi:hypothetical protein